jgi:alanine or glycine:cation symporter, AGCS family
MSLSQIIQNVNGIALGLPTLIIVIAVCIVCTFALRFIQFRYFIRAWRYTLFPEKKTTGEMSPLQAFINSLSTGLGNGSVAGVATAVYSGGPGAAFWIFAIGFIVMAVRYAEVFLSIYFIPRPPNTQTMGGPMQYLHSAPFGAWLVRIYVFFGLIFCLVVGNGMQTNSMAISFKATCGISPLIVALLLFAFTLYVVFGGAPRIIRVSDRLVPLKVVTFFTASIAVLCYHYNNIIPSLQLIVSAAFSPLALAGGMFGFTVQQAVKYGLIRSIAATESGLGTTAIFYGSSGSKEPVESGTMSMLSSFISTVVCCIVALCIIASGVWDSGLQSTALTVAAFNTVFGSFGGWIVSFLSMTFGVGVIVSYAYLTREFWFYITNRRYETVFALLYCVIGFCAVFVEPTVLWSFVDIPNAAMLLINLFGIVYLLPLIRRETLKFMAHH